MQKNLNRNLLVYYFTKYDVEKIFDKEIISYAELHFFEREEFILEAESELEYYYLLVDGKIRISFLFENGKSMLLKLYKEFITIGDLELLKNKSIRCNVEAIEDTYLIAIPSTVLRKNYMDNLNFLRHLVESLGEKLDATINNSSYNSVYPLINRLSSYLVERITDKNYVQLDSSFKEIAEFLGTTYRHLNRTFKELESKSIINCKNKKVYILSEDRLRELSKNVYIESI